MEPTYGTSLHYSGTAGERYFAWQNANGPVRGEINARKFRQYVGPADTVLDFGCGGGHLLAALACKRRIGIEINATARQEAQMRGVECYERAEHVPDHVANVAISNHALEHVPYPIAALREVRRALLTDGLFVLVVPIDDWRMHRYYDASDINHHLNTWTIQLLGNTLTEAGFDVGRKDISVLTHAWPPMYDRLYRRSPPLFDVVARIWSVARRRRQLVAAVRPSGEAAV